MYLSLFRVNKTMRQVTQAMIAFLVVNAIAWFIPSVVVCHPISTYWSLKVQSGRCINFNVFGTWISLPHIVSDLLIMALPLPLLWTMQMSKAKKIGLALTFLTASV